MKKILAVAVAVVLAGAWYAFRPERLVIDAVVDEAPSAGVEAVVARGTFRGVAHDARGTATIHRRADGSRVLRLADFETSNGPDLQLYLVAAHDAADSKAVTSAGFRSLGALKGNAGNQNYDVPADVDLGKYGAVTVWCRRFSVNFATAPLAPEPATASR